MTTRTFTKTELLDMGLPFDAPEGGEIISDEIDGQGRWTTDHTLVFRLADQPNGEAWQVDYSIGATESQDESPWQYTENVTATLVRRTTKMVEVWEPVTNG